MHSPTAALSGKHTLLVCMGLLLMAPGAAPLHATTRIKVRLLTPVSSYFSHSGDPIEALVVPPACSEPSNAFPPETVIAGQVSSVRRVS